MKEDEERTEEERGEFGKISLRVSCPRVETDQTRSCGTHRRIGRSVSAPVCTASHPLADELGHAHSQSLCVLTQT